MQRKRNCSTKPNDFGIYKVVLRNEQFSDPNKIPL
jgi:hypothetical protein